MDRITPKKLSLVPALLLGFSLLGSVGAQGNGGDAKLEATYDGQLPGMSLFRYAAPWTPMRLRLTTPGGTLVGAPLLFAGEIFQGTPPSMDLPGEPGVIGLSLNLFVLANGFGPGAQANLGGGGLNFDLVAPPGFEGSRIVFQAAVADPTRLNGLAITECQGVCLDGVPTVTQVAPVLNPAANLAYGLEVADIDGNGTPEILAGAREADAQGVSRAGRVFIFEGTSTTPSIVLDDPAPEIRSQFGTSMSTGDLNGDGFIDICVGARLADVTVGTSTFIDAGEAFVFYGPTYTNVTTLRAAQPQADGQFGHWSAIGDFDGDGFEDLAVSEIRATVNGVFSAGAVTIFYGPSLAPSLVLPNPTPGLADRFGYRLVAKDFDQDGFCDLASAAPFRSVSTQGGDESGAVYVFSGPFLSLTTYYANPSPSPFGLLGADMVAKDITGDGHLDLIVGAELDGSGGTPDQGSVHILEGPDFTTVSVVYAPDPVTPDGAGSGVDVGDFNGDGTPDLMIGQFYNSTQVFHGGRASVLLGPDYLQSISVFEPFASTNNEFGRRIRSADLDGDGKDEMIVGVPFSSPNSSPRSGAFYIVDL